MTVVFYPLLQHGVRSLNFLGHRLGFLIHLHILGRIVGQVGVSMRMPSDQEFLIPLVERCRVKGQGEVEEFESFGKRLLRCRVLV